MGSQSRLKSRALDGNSLDEDESALSDSCGPDLSGWGVEWGELFGKSVGRCGTCGGEVGKRCARNEGLDGGRPARIGPVDVGRCG